ncbi:MAG: amidohydrolase family protein [Niveispirillum sp.]|uniref:amidohydrolase family protein n=1 Tax=Niveispirillum sp. TaxID=1917217 RepID=UPI003BA72251
MARSRTGRWMVAGLALVLAGCATGQTANQSKDKNKDDDKGVLAQGLDPAVNRDPFPSRYKPAASGLVALTGATVLTGTGQRIDNGTVIIRDGKIEAVGAALPVPAGATMVNASGRYITPGVIDMHSHLGVYAAPAVQAHSDGNEATAPNTAEVWAEHSVWPQDPGFERALRGGVTTLQILPGSANLFGGRSVTLKNVPARNVQEMKFPGAPYGLKMACGENPKRVYGSKGRAPASRMSNVAGYRKAWIEAADYRRKWDAYYEKQKKGGDGDKGPGDPPKRDLQLDTLADVLRGEILIQNHCYRADEMSVMLDIAKEFGYSIRAFHHASEAYKIGDLLKESDTCIATWAHWWGFKMEAYDGVPANAAIVHHKGACAVIHSDDETLIQHLNKETAQAMAEGRYLGLDIKDEEAIAWITANPAKAIGVQDKTGTLEPGKMADLVVWSGNPFSIYTLADLVYIDGVLMHDRANPPAQPRSDFELGQSGPEIFKAGVK